MDTGKLRQWMVALEDIFQGTAIIVHYEKFRLTQEQFCGFVNFAASIFVDTYTSSNFRMAKFSKRTGLQAFRNKLMFYHPKTRRFAAS